MCWYRVVHDLYTTWYLHIKLPHIAWFQYFQRSPSDALCVQPDTCTTYSCTTLHATCFAYNLVSVHRAPAKWHTLIQASTSTSNAHQGTQFVLKHQNALCIQPGTSTLRFHQPKQSAYSLVPVHRDSTMRQILHRPWSQYIKRLPSDILSGRSRYSN